MDIELVSALSTYAPIMRSNNSSTRAINGFSVFIHPVPNSFQAVEGKRRECSSRLRAYIKQQVCILPRCPNQHLYQFFGRFIVAVGNRIAPVVIDRLAWFERQSADALPRKPCLVLTGKIAFEYLNVFTGIGSLMMIVTNKTLWL